MAFRFTSDRKLKREKLDSIDPKIRKRFHFLVYTVIVETIVIISMAFALLAG